jgi:hypothetical protein
MYYGHGHGHEAWTRTCTMNVYMHHGREHVAWTLTCTMGKDIGMYHRNTAWTLTCRMDMDMPHRHGHAAWTLGTLKCKTTISGSGWLMGIVFRWLHTVQQKNEFKIFQTQALRWS